MRRSIDFLPPIFGIAIVGALAGALCGVLLLAADLAQAAPGNLTREALPYFIAVTYLGAAIGAVVAPAVHSTLLRQVPLARAFAFATAGTLAGGAVGVLLVRHAQGFGVEVATVALAAFAGLALAVIALRARGARQIEAP